MDNLAVTTATFGTSDLVSTGTEIYPHVSQAQIANNTGYIYYRPQCVCDQVTGASNGTEWQQVHILAGTYQAYARGSFTVMGTNTGEVGLDGTTLLTVSGSSAGWYEDDAEVIITSTGWHNVSFATDDASMTILHSSIAVRHKI